MERGWVAIWRKSVDASVFQNEGLWKVWTWCLMKATHRPQWVPMKTGRGTRELELQPGQFIFGRNVAAKELNMAPSTVRNRMAKLKKLGNLDIQEDTHFSIVSIVNWDSYQFGPKNEDSQQDNQRTTKGHIQQQREYKGKTGRAYQHFKEEL